MAFTADTGLQSFLCNASMRKGFQRAAFESNPLLGFPLKAFFKDAVLQTQQTKTRFGCDWGQKRHSSRHLSLFSPHEKATPTASKHCLHYKKKMFRRFPITFPWDSYRSLVAPCYFPKTRSLDFPAFLWKHMKTVAAPILKKAWKGTQSPSITSLSNWVRGSPIYILC